MLTPAHFLKAISRGLWRGIQVSKKIPLTSIVTPWIVVFLILVHCSWIAFADNVQSAAYKHYHSGLAYERLGRLDEAYTQLQLACALDAEDVRSALALGVVALRLGQDEMAKRYLEKSITLDANSVASYYVLGLLYEKQKSFDRAIDSWKRFMEINRDDLLRIEAQKHLQWLESQRS
jgi:tetratricopeptide (TPR) repeat protein